ncbi:MAG: hypothetical protein EZS28_029964 [Streblomastix strix]|uniref:NrS-1 polymerase-like helicase domain-containing protein n=1 Tax=Streblomastix strix TaxID=222440 RepID=A0A5J4UWH5_9EUKA|nr:MAG: hypothetical protein EZS28_029964 [Streblomastix strix]
MNGKYDNKLELVAEDLLKVINAAPCQNGWCYIVKEYDCLNEKNVINYKNKTAIYDQLRTIRLWQDGKKHITAIDALEQYHSLFEKLGIKFISQNPKIFSTFQGYKYIQVDEIDQTKIDQFLGLVKDTISANNELIYEYLLNWIAYIIQNAGKKTETAPILQGLQGYSTKNVTDIDDMVGKFNAVIENKMLVIANEMKNCGDARMPNMDALKSIITDSSFQVNEKYIPKRKVENVVNLIIVTNNVFPVKIENSDRRYVVCKCSSTHRGDSKYFDNLDIESFNPRVILMTEAKKDIINASRSPLDDVIIKHFKAFQEGVTTPMAEA